MAHSLKLFLLSSGNLHWHGITRPLARDAVSVSHGFTLLFFRESSMSATISEQNDMFRTSVASGLPCQTYPGRFVVTHCVQHLPGDVLQEVLKKLAEFDSFTNDNDPYGEHDFGSFEHAGETYNWKIDYYDENYEFGSENPVDATTTRRVLTLMLAAEY